MDNNQLKLLRTIFLPFTPLLAVFIYLFFHHSPSSINWMLQDVKQVNHKNNIYYVQASNISPKMQTNFQQLKNGHVQAKVNKTVVFL